MDHRQDAERGNEPGSPSRRRFIRRTSAAAGAAVLASTARSYGRILGANDRIQIGQIGCSDRAFGLRRFIVWLLRRLVSRCTHGREPA